jgi:hypothetical protein
MPAEGRGGFHGKNMSAQQAYHPHTENPQFFFARTKISFDLKREEVINKG